MSKAKEKYSFREYNKHSDNYYFIITEHGHTMMAADVVKGLNEKEILLKKVKELEQEKKEMQKVMENSIEKLIKIDELCDKGK